jgi:hypothetical protein
LDRQTFHIYTTKMRINTARAVSKIRVPLIFSTDRHRLTWKSDCERTYDVEGGYESILSGVSVAVSVLRR